MDEPQAKRGILPPGRAGRWWLLALAVILALYCGIAFYIKWNDGLRDVDLLEFATIYISAPLGISLLLLFGYLNRSPQNEEDE